MRVMVVGSGGREHALLWKLRQSREVSRLYALPGNAGTEELATNVREDPSRPDLVEEAARAHRIDLVVIGPEAPLAAGVVDALAARGRPVFGPTQAAARIETSKRYAKELMQEAGVPTGAFRPVKDLATARELLGGRRRWVVKADGLMGGKGVTVPDSPEEALAATERLLAAGQEVLFEEYLEGEEASLFALTDGERYLLLPPVRDHKRLRAGDRGPNTGGMGAYTPLPDFPQAAAEETAQQVVAPALEALRRRGTPFAGCLFCGLMLTEEGPRVLEYNARFGDPEAQALMLALEGDLFPVLFGIAEGSLPQAPELRPGGQAVVAVVLAAPGYPDAPVTGAPIEGLERAQEEEGVAVFHAGTRREGREVMTAGGRVVTVVGKGIDLGEARERAYRAAAFIRFPGCQYREDIAARALA